MKAFLFDSVGSPPASNPHPWVSCATGPGAGARNSIGITLVSGMIIGTFFTLFVVPSIYMLVAHSRSRVAEREPERNEAALAGVAPASA